MAVSNSDLSFSYKTFANGYSLSLSGLDKDILEKEAPRHRCHPSTALVQLSADRRESLG